MRTLSPHGRQLLLLALAAALVCAALVQSTRLHLASVTGRMFLAPMIGVIEPCILPPSGEAASRDPALAASCGGPQGSAAALVESTLAAMSPEQGAQRFELGYTLPVPLLQLFKAEGGDWVIDREMVSRFVRTIRDVQRPAIVYLFSNHFATGAPIEEVLGANPANLGETPQGPLPKGTYYASPIYNWNFASTGTPITARRVEAARAVVEEICRLAPEHRARIKGVTLLGELHHLFPDFESGMGFASPYRVTDYSAASRQGFRDFLKREYPNLAALNRHLGTTWTSFEQIQPPAKDIRREPLNDFTDHIDSFAHGTLPIAGWAHVKRENGSPAWVRIYRNGELIARTPIDLGRQDVLQALPELGDANTGWRFDMPFRDLPAGLHKIDVFVEAERGKLMQLASRQIAIVDRQQRTPLPQPQQPLPPSEPLDGAIKAHIDQPADQSSYFFNPLVPLWHAFRQQQVVSYLRSFSAVVDASCLNKTRQYTHQIIPFTNPGWDETKFAIDASLEDLGRIRLGVSLYGEAAYGQSFKGWLKTKSHHAYGVTEFHPLKQFTAGDLRKVLQAHADQGAEFVSFFLEPRWKGQLVPRPHNIFSFDPANPKFGSDRLYEAARGANTAAP